ncbi:hypothetical protein KUTeg_021721 [Tegillarca granosa]|uniref:Pectinesterase inhibitor domain-containing protein n=1 Tax=Tegillarca granosa TaxID=220873 RepID=A0ABQ9E4L4_TEGGR|nr:hypothetical protein KUTeg_021721 [Tegillarca granosa]
MVIVRMIQVITLMCLLNIPSNYAFLIKLHDAFEAAAEALEMIPTILETASSFEDDKAIKKIQKSLTYLNDKQEELSELNDLVIVQNAVAAAKKKIQACTESLQDYLNYSSAVSKKEVEDCRLVFIEVKFLAHVLHGRTDYDTDCVAKARVEMINNSRATAMVEQDQRINYIKLDKGPTDRGITEMETIRATIEVTRMYN